MKYNPPRYLSKSAAEAFERYQRYMEFDECQLDSLAQYCHLLAVFERSAMESGDEIEVEDGVGNVKRTSPAIRVQLQVCRELQHLSKALGLHEKKEQELDYSINLDD